MPGGEPSCGGERATPQPPACPVQARVAGGARSATAHRAPQATLKGSLHTPNWPNG